MEFLAEADDTEVTAFMDGVPAAKLPVASKSEKVRSEEADVAFTTDEDVGEAVSSRANAEAPVKFMPEGGRIIAESQIKLVPKDPAASIFYTLDGSTPTISSKK